MPDLGNRASVMGPQPIARRHPVPSEMLAAAERAAGLLAAGKDADLEAMTTPEARAEVAALAGAVSPGVYDCHHIIGQARVNSHYYLKIQFGPPAAAPCTVQFRLGELDGKWLIWEAVNLSGRRSGWTR